MPARSRSSRTRRPILLRSTAFWCWAIVGPRYFYGSTLCDSIEVAIRFGQMTFSPPMARRCIQGVRAGLYWLITIATLSATAARPLEAQERRITVWSTSVGKSSLAVVARSQGVVDIDASDGFVSFVRSTLAVDS